MERLHRQGVAQDKRAPFLGTQVGKPGPRKDTFDGDDNIGAIGCDSFAQRISTGWHIAMQHHLAVLTQDTDVHGAGMQVDTTVQWTVLSVEAHEGSSSCE